MKIEFIDFFLLLNGHMCYVKMFVLRHLLCNDVFCCELRCVYTYFLLVLARCFRIICGFWVGRQVNAFGLSDFLRV